MVNPEADIGETPTGVQEADPGSMGEYSNTFMEKPLAQPAQPANPVADSEPAVNTEPAA